MDELFQQLLRSPLFEPRQRHHVNLKTYMDLTIKRMHAIFGTGLINNDLWLGQPRQSEFSSLCKLMGYLGAFDYALHSSIVDHIFRGLSHIHVVLEPADSAITRCFSAAPWEKNGGYCRALRAGNLVVTSGTVAFDEQGNPYAAGDVYRQTRRCLEIIEAALQQLGVDRTLVVATRMYTTDVAWWPQIAKAHQEFFSHCPPTTMLLGVNQLIAPAYLIEIEAQAWTGL